MNRPIHTLISVSTSQYEAAHGKKPRGKALWVFKLSGHLTGKTEEFWSLGNEPWGQAKRKACEDARDGGYTLVTLLP